MSDAGATPSEESTGRSRRLRRLREEEEAAIQDQGSLDQPIQTTEPTEAASDVGTEELREEARRRVTGVNRPREPFSWEAPPPGKRS